jgi:hypothetical protein
MANPGIDHRIFAILVIIVLAELPDIVWWIANDNSDRSALEPLYSRSIRPVS